MYKMIFSDIDGTLLNSKREIPNRLKEKIHQLDRHGTVFVLTSSRMGTSIFPIADELGIKAPIIAYGGAIIYDKNREIVRSFDIAVYVAQEIHNFILKQNPNICCCIYSDDLWLADDLTNPWIKREEEISGVNAVQAKICDCPGHSGVHKLLCMGDAEDIGGIMCKLKKRYPTLAITRSKNTYLEINNVAATKENAMRWLCSEYNISVSQTIAFGDSDTDLNMIKEAGRGYIMANAPESLKRNAPNIADSNDEDGVLSALANIGI